MATLHDKMDSDWIRLKTLDGHLGALYHPHRHIIRFVRGGTVDYNLATYIQQQPKEQVTVDRDRGE